MHHYQQSRDLHIRVYFRQSFDRTRTLLAEMMSINMVRYRTYSSKLTVIQFRVIMKTTPTHSRSSSSHFPIYVLRYIGDYICE